MWVWLMGTLVGTSVPWEALASTAQSVSSLLLTLHLLRHSNLDRPPSLMNDLPVAALTMRSAVRLSHVAPLSSDMSLQGRSACSAVGSLSMSGGATFRRPPPGRATMLDGRGLLMSRQSACPLVVMDRPQPCARVASGGRLVSMSSMVTGLSEPLMPKSSVMTSLVMRMCLAAGLWRGAMDMSGGKYSLPMKGGRPER